MGGTRRYLHGTVLVLATLPPSCRWPEGLSTENDGWMEMKTRIDVRQAQVEEVFDLQW